MSRGQLAEFGIVLPQGVGHATRLAERAPAGEDFDLADVVGKVLNELSEQLLFLQGRIAGYSREMTQVARQEDRVTIMQTKPGIGPITASAIVATVGTARQFKNGPEFAAWLGLTPQNRSSGGKERLGRISKMGDQYIRRLLVVGMMSRMRQIIKTPERYDPWFAEIVARKPGKVAAVAITFTSLATKMSLKPRLARILPWKDEFQHILWHH